MIPFVYLDSSVLLRQLFQQPGMLAEWTDIECGVDAIHLATALLWREETGADLVLATHDATLARAARASGLPVIGA